ncbi:MAG: transposase [Deltaproteobacteria bacterium]|nr:transposase [Deltaproteobacteria bacterium]
MTYPYRDVIRARTILFLADGVSQVEVARRVGLRRRIVRKWADAHRSGPRDLAQTQTPDRVHRVTRRHRSRDARVGLIHVLCDNLSIHAGQLARAWLAAHPRFRMHFAPVHCSWMNQVEQWFSILQRKRAELRKPLQTSSRRSSHSSTSGTRSPIRSSGRQSRSTRY